MSSAKIERFKLKSPNDNLTIFGIALLLLLFVSIYQDTRGVVIGVGIIVKILVLVWVPKAARLVERNSIGWTIFAFFTPSIALIILGSIGYRKTPEILEMASQCDKAFLDKQQKLGELLGEKSISEEDYYKTVNIYHTELQEFAKEQLNQLYDKDDAQFLNSELERKGFVIDSNSDIFVEFDDSCPACSAKLSSDQNECPACGLNLR